MYTAFRATTLFMVVLVVAGLSGRGVACKNIREVVVDGSGDTQVYAIDSAVTLAVEQVRGVKIAALTNITAETKFGSNGNNNNMYIEENISATTSGIVEYFSVLEHQVSEGVHHVKVKVAICKDPVIKILADKYIKDNIIRVLNGPYLIADSCQYGCDYIVSFANGEYSVSDRNSYQLCQSEQLLETVNCISNNNLQANKKYSIVFSNVKRRASRYKILSALNIFAPVEVLSSDYTDKQLSVSVKIPSSANICKSLDALLRSKVLDGTIVNCDSQQALVKLRFE